MSAQPAESISPSPIPKSTNADPSVSSSVINTAVEILRNLLQIGSPHRYRSTPDKVRFWITPMVLGVVLGLVTSFSIKEYGTELSGYLEQLAPESLSTDELSEADSLQLSRENTLVQPLTSEHGASAPIPTEATTPNTPKLIEPAAADSPIPYHLERGDTLLKVWNKFGASVASGLKAAEALSTAGVPFTALKPGDILQIKKSSDSEISFLSFELKGGKAVTLEGNSKSGYSVKVSEPVSEQLERKVSGTISHSFSLAAQAAAVPVSIVDDLADLFGSKIDFRKDIHRGDSFTIFYTEKRTENGKLLEVSPIKAASLEISGKLYAAVRHQTSEGKTYYFDESGKAFGDFFLRYPLQFSRISSVYSDSRLHPVLNINRAHRGVDFAARIGTPVRSIGDGVIVDAGLRGAAGNMIKISHGDRYTTAYKHLNSITKNLVKGKKVSRGQVIGTVGASGLASGPHLHFELYDNQQYVNPLSTKLDFELPAKEAIPPAQLAIQIAALREAHSSLALAKLNQ